MFKVNNPVHVRFTKKFGEAIVHVIKFMKW